MSDPHGSDPHCSSQQERTPGAGKHKFDFSGALLISTAVLGAALFIPIVGSMLLGEDSFLAEILDAVLFLAAIGACIVLTILLIVMLLPVVLVAVGLVCTGFKRIFARPK